MSASHISRAYLHIPTNLPQHLSLNKVFHGVQCPSPILAALAQVTPHVNGQLLTVFSSLYDSRAPGTAESTAGDETATRTRLEALSKIREKRWALYVARAVDRFESWWNGFLVRLEPQRQHLTVSDMWNTAYTDWPRSGSLQRWTREMLPPLGKF